MSMFDQRGAAFLEEMGIGPLWLLRDAPDAADAPEAAEVAAQPEPVHAAGPAPVAPVQARFEPAHPRDPVSVPAAQTVSALAPVAKSVDSAWADEEAVAASDEAIAAMGWDELKAAIASCTRCSICKGRKVVYGDGARQARWLVTAGAASAADEKDGLPLSGEAGKLLANMLGAAGLSREADAYVTNLIKCRPVSANGGDRAPSADEARACRPFLERELALTGAATVLSLGQIAANALRERPLQEPLAQSRGQVHRFNGVALVTTFHPGELLRRGADKALAWADLCLARGADGPAA